MDKIIKFFQELSEIHFVNSLIILLSVYFGFYLNERAQTKKDTKEAKQILDVTYNEIINNYDNNLKDKFSPVYLSTLSSNALNNIKMGMLTNQQKEKLIWITKIYSHFYSINNAVSMWAEFEKIGNPNQQTNLAKNDAYSKIEELRKICKKDIEAYLNKGSK